MVGCQVDERQVLGNKAQELHTLLVIRFDDLIIFRQKTLMRQVMNGLQRRLCNSRDARLNIPYTFSGDRPICTVIIFRFLHLREDFSGFFHLIWHQLRLAARAYLKPLYLLFGAPEFNLELLNHHLQLLIGCLNVELDLILDEFCALGESQ
jgi:hypothetical protein